MLGRRSSTRSSRQCTEDYDSDYCVSDDSDSAPQPPVITKNGWTLRGTTLLYRGHLRMEAPRLRLVIAVRMNPQPKSAEEIEAKQFIDGTNLRAFFHSQMAHYGLFKRNGMDIDAQYMPRRLEPKVARALEDGLVSVRLLISVEIFSNLCILTV